LATSRDSSKKKEFGILFCWVELALVLKVLLTNFISNCFLSSLWFHSI